jgi:hypothetical protein
MKASVSYIFDTTKAALLLAIEEVHSATKSINSH